MLQYSITLIGSQLEKKTFELFALNNFMYCKVTEKYVYKNFYFFFSYFKFIINIVCMLFLSLPQNHPIILDIDITELDLSKSLYLPGA